MEEWLTSQIRNEPLTPEADLLLRTDKQYLWDQLVDRGHLFARDEPLDALRSGLVRLPLESGVVVGMVAEDPFPGSYEYWYMVQHLSGRNQVWQYRRGTSLLRGNNDYWEWLLANVARPPVYAFLMMLTVFVLLVGPVSYYWTRRIGRTFLMFLIAPTLATLATLAFFGYGLIADGLGTQARVRQISWADGATGRAARSTRSTYFAAFPQSAGLRFPGNSAVYPITNPDQAIQRYQRMQERFTRQVVLSDDSQRFLGEFLLPRTQCQFVAFRPLQEKCGIAIDMDPAYPSPRITNHFAETVRYLIGRTDDGRYWVLDEACDAGETGIFKTLLAEETSSALRELYRREQPDVPPGFSASMMSRRSMYMSVDLSSRYRPDNRSWSKTGDDRGIFEARLREMLVDAAELPPGSYVGIADLGEEAIAVEGADSVSSIHIVMGSFL